MLRQALSVLCTATLARAAPRTGFDAMLQIEHGAPAAPILAPGALFGSFFEDFLHAGDGGVYAEKLSNRALALPLSNASSFRCSGDVGSGLCTWYTEKGTVRRDDSVPLNDAVPHAMWLSGPSSIATNAGFPGGIAVKAGDTLALSLFVYVKTGPVSLEARLVDGWGDVTLGSATVLHAATNLPRWKEVKVELKVQSSSGADGCRFQLRLTGGAGAEAGVSVISRKIVMFSRVACCPSR